MRVFSACRAAAVTMLMLLAAAPRVQAQQVPQSDRPVAVERPSHRGAYPLLSEAHWAVRAARRAEALGLAPRFLPPQRAARWDAVVEALTEAQAAATETGDPALEALAQGWRSRASAEFPEVTSGGSDREPLLLRSYASAGVGRRSGFVEPATLFPPPLDEPKELESSTDPLLALSFAARPHWSLSLQAVPALRGADLDLDRWEVAAAAKGWSLSAGKRELGFGSSRSGGVVLSETRIEQVAIESTRAFRLPGLLSAAGPLAASAALGRFDERRHPDQPLFFAMSAKLRPHSRLTLGLQRAAMFAGDSTGIAVTPRSVGKMLLGVYGGTYSFENQVLSASVRLRLPTERVLPVTVYGEWGAEDSSGAWWNVPGRVFGLWVPAVPRLPALGFGVERTSFGGSCCGNAEWYRHFSFRGHWVTGDQPLGHPLGGEGTEWLAYADLDPPGRGLHVDGRIFARDRGGENLFAPARAGHSTGGAATLSWRLFQQAELWAEAFAEAGDGWSAHELRAGSRYFF